MSNIMEILNLLMGGMWVSLQIFVLTLLFSLPLGFLICFGRQSKNIIISTIFRIYISIMRGTPLMLQLFVVYYAPFYLFGIKLSIFGPNYRLIAVLIGFILNYAAYFAEIFRGGIQSMSKGQYEAATVLGFSKMQTYFKIILPQVIKRVLPSVSNEIITLVKDTSLAQVLSVTEMFTKASAAASAQVSVVPFIVAGAFYYAMNLIIEQILNRVEKSMSYYS